VINIHNWKAQVLLWRSDRKYSNTVMQAEVLSLRSTLQQLEVELKKERSLRLEAEKALELSETERTRLQVNKLTPPTILSLSFTICSLMVNT
jgi:hypothetical protein